MSAEETARGVVARRLGLGEEEVASVEQVALLHDVGKIGIADSVLNKPGAPLDVVAGNARPSACWNV